MIVNAVVRIALASAVSFAVVVALDERRTVQVALSGDARRVGLLVVDVTGVAADPATGQAPDQLVERDIDMDGQIDPGGPAGRRCAGGWRHDRRLRRAAPPAPEG